MLACCFGLNPSLKFCLIPSVRLSITAVLLTGASSLSAVCLVTLNMKKSQKRVGCCSVGQVACGLGVINSCVPF